MAHYHPSDDLLMRFSAGQLANALGIMVACHLTRCEQCSHHTNWYERLGGDLLNECDGVTVEPDTLSNLLKKLNEPEIPSEPKQCVDARIPKPLQRFVPGYYEQLPWSGMVPGVREYVLPFSDTIYTAKFYKISAGKELPEHTHRGSEYTLVMEGSFADKSGRYQEGDFILADTQTIHQPTAAMERDCICFAVMDAPIKMTGFFGRMLNPFIR